VRSDMADSFKEESGLRICTLWIYPGQASKPLWCRRGQEAARTASPAAANPPDPLAVATANRPSPQNRIRGATRHPRFARDNGDWLDRPQTTLSQTIGRCESAAAARSRIALSSRAATEAHAASTCCRYFSYKLPGGYGRSQEKSRAEHRLFTTAQSYARAFAPASPVVRSPLDPG